MADTTELEVRLDKLSAEWGLTKKKMFAGHGYMLNGNLAFGSHAKDEIILRADEVKVKELLKQSGFRVFDMGRGPAKNWLFVGSPAIEDDKALGKLLEIGRDFAASLQAKK